MKKHLIIVLTVVAALGFFSACSATKPQQESSPNVNADNLQRSNDEGEVAINITFANPLGVQKKGYLSFVVTLNTHSVDLSRYPLNKYAKLYDLKGNLVSSESEWETNGEGHHLIGKLHFKTDVDLKVLDGLKLVIENYGGAPKREYTWDKKALNF